MLGPSGNVIISEPGHFGVIGLCPECRKNDHSQAAAASPEFGQEQTFVAKYQLCPRISAFALDSADFDIQREEPVSIFGVNSSNSSC